MRPALDAAALRLDFGGLMQLMIPLNAFTEVATADVWGKRIASLAAPDDLTSCANDFLGARVRLVALEPTAKRAFVDSRPVLVTTTASLLALNALLRQAIGMERFRPNVVIEGEVGSWRRLQANDVTLEREKPCSRCEVTAIDQASGARRGEEPLRMLNERFAGNFGVYCRVARSGRLRIGEVLQPTS